jgi:hypothetical protein
MVALPCVCSEKDLSSRVDVIRFQKSCRKLGWSDSSHHGPHANAGLYFLSLQESDWFSLRGFFGCLPLWWRHFTILHKVDLSLFAAVAMKGRGRGLCCSSASLISFGENPAWYKITNRSVIVVRLGRPAFLYISRSIGSCCWYVHPIERHIGTVG